MHMHNDFRTDRAMNAQHRQGIPLIADPDGVRSLHLRALSRAALAVADRALDGGSMPSTRSTEDFLRRRGWEGDRIAMMVARAATAPALTTQAGWAQELAGVALAFLTTLKPMSAGAEFLAQCLRLDLSGIASLTLPALNAGQAGWVAEGAPIRVLRMITSAQATLTPRKLAAICELSREMMEGSNAEAILTQALIDTGAPALDAALFSNVAGDAMRPAGLLVGATSVTPSANTVPSEAMGDDLGALAAAISPYAGNGSIALVLAPAQAMRVALASHVAFPVLMSGALANGSAIMVATNAVACTIQPTRLDAAKSVTLHEEDTTPGAVGSASPGRSLFQTDSVALRMIMPVSWAVRDRVR
jgi:hypothetical protein